ncbi:MAG: universal stress protein, partial [Deltaproteobacteria bacterium]|nr:universal stress protein [Deltaproteobacteria bacterium]
MALTTIIVGCDLSAPADHALDRAVALAELHGARIVLVHAEANDAPVPEVDNAMLAQIGEVSAAVRVVEARHLADRLAAIEARGLRADLVSRVGPADEVLAAAALEHAAELVVIGSHGHTGLTRMLLGSVASSTIRHATCDVLVCRGPSVKAPFQRPLVATDFSEAAAKALAHAALLAAP